MTSPRVLMWIQHFRPAFTGHGRQVEALSAELAARGASVEIATALIPGAPEVEEGTVPVHRFPMPVVSNPIALRWGHRAFLRYLRQQRNRFDILHVHGVPPGLVFTLPAAHRHGFRTVLTTTLLGSDDPLTVRTGGRLARWRYRVYTRAGAHIAISPALARTFAEAGFAESRVYQIPVGVSTERFHPPRDRNEEASRLGWDEKAPRALFVGAPLPRKGFDVLLDAWEKVLERLPQARLYVAGPTTPPRGTEAERAFAADCRERTERPPLRGRVVLLGPREDVPDLYRAAHVFVFPSRREGFPNVLLEAIASATPCVVTRIPGSTDVSVRDGESGYVVDQEDAAALADRIVKLLSDPGLRARFGTRARADAENLYAFSVVAEAHLRLYRSLLQGGETGVERG